LLRASKRFKKHRTWDGWLTGISKWCANMMLRHNVM
jgi:hypothetical protein